MSETKAAFKVDKKGLFSDCLCISKVVNKQIVQFYHPSLSILPWQFIFSTFHPCSYNKVLGNILAKVLRTLVECWIVFAWLVAIKAASPFWNEGGRSRRRKMMASCWKRLSSTKKRKGIFTYYQRCHGEEHFADCRFT